jgi:cell division protein FtsB
VKKFGRILRNKYIISLLLFGVWMTFFDNNDIFRHMRHQRILTDLNREKNELSTRIDEVKRQMTELQNHTLLEKFAREQYYFKKDNEEVFVVVANEE